VVAEASTRRFEVGELSAAVPPAVSTDVPRLSASAPAGAIEAAGAARESIFAVAGSGMLFGGAKGILSVCFFETAGEAPARAGFAAGGAVGPAVDVGGGKGRGGRVGGDVGGNAII